VAKPKQELDVFQTAETVAMLEALGIKVSEVLDASKEIGDGWHVLPDKDMLVNVPFIITDYRFRDGDFVDEDGNKKQYVVLRCVTREAVETAGKTGKWVVVDGSTGIKDQIGKWISDKQVDMTADTVPALVCKGLVRSDYDGPQGPAHTYYIQT
jgi:hypothetical protein